MKNKTCCTFIILYIYIIKKSANKLCCDKKVKDKKHSVLHDISTVKSLSSGMIYIIYMLEIR